MPFNDNIHANLDIPSEQKQVIKSRKDIDHEQHSHTHLGYDCDGIHSHLQNRYHSFAAERAGNRAKWFVDGCGYFWALSVALEEAQHSIWIMDWWLSPEVYLRRPPSRFEKYRFDRMLQAAALRGVKVQILLNNEVDAALAVGSVHTKRTLEALHENISVFLCPDHLQNKRNMQADTMNLFPPSHDTVNLTTLTIEPLDWVYHEKLCVVDNQTAFIGGVDICFGRWDTNDYLIADVHPTNLDDIMFPGQDYNNARVFDFRQVDHPKENRLDRTKTARMGWTDLSICLEGPAVEDICAHFVQRWNFEYDLQYGADLSGRLQPLALSGVSDRYHDNGTKVHTFATTEGTGLRGRSPQRMVDSADPNGGNDVTNDGGLSAQVIRSVGRWSHGTLTEHSIANAYVQIIEKSQYFIYIENQYFMMSTSEDQELPLNKIGGAIVDRIIRAARAHEKYKVIVVMPAVPAFAGEVQYDSSPGTLAIMGLQYKSISRGKHSIMEKIKDAGFDPKDYISFYNLRSYDRIDTSSNMSEAERKSGVSYESARKEHDDAVGAGYNGRGEGTCADTGHPESNYARYQQAACTNKGQNDGITSPSSQNGLGFSSVPWASGNTEEIDAIVSEEVYVHSKFLIADDRIVIVGSANLNDRSQLGYHDSEIAVVTEDSIFVDSLMNGESFTAGRFATSLRRQLFRRYMGLLPRQDPRQPDDNFLPLNKTENAYDWGSDGDQLVVDPLSESFEALWKGTARTNTDAFERVFRPVPSNSVRNWDDYDTYYGQYFSERLEGNLKLKPSFEYGHVFKENFPEGIQQVKQELDKIKGTLVEMPLDFLSDVQDLEREGFGSEPFRPEIYV